MINGSWTAAQVTTGIRNLCAGTALSGLSQLHAERYELMTRQWNFVLFCYKSTLWKIRSQAETPCAQVSFWFIRPLKGIAEKQVPAKLKPIVGQCKFDLRSMPKTSKLRQVVYYSTRIGIYTTLLFILQGVYTTLCLLWIKTQLLQSKPMLCTKKVFAIYSEKLFSFLAYDFLEFYAS